MAFVSARIASKSGSAMMAGSGNWERSTAGMIYSLSVMVNSTFCMVCMTVPDSVTRRGLLPSRQRRWRPGQCGVPIVSAQSRQHSCIADAWCYSWFVNQIRHKAAIFRRITRLASGVVRMSLTDCFRCSISFRFPFRPGSFLCSGCHCGPPVESLPPLTPPCLCVCTVMPLR
ncbi:Uncharacterised protein [Escherichia coli]|uniref:Uncharacterized protein n=1 Tax=Escherichia coli TaxID=562 RepID=A0A376U6E6_ECOLX|nr:Uncharacterised protein [Escherichia coli]